MKLLVMRHGRTDLNDKGYFNGQYDEPINAQGREEAWAARERLRKMVDEGLKVDKIYCSPLQRAYETCEIATDWLKMQPILDARLMERTMGTLDGRDLGMAGFDVTQLFNYDYDPELPGFENWQTVCTRVREFLAEVAEKDDETVLIVTHGGVARAMYYCLNPLPKDHIMSEPALKNCEIYEFELV